MTKRKTKTRAREGREQKRLQEKISEQVDHQSTYEQEEVSMLEEDVWADEREYPSKVISISQAPNQAPNQATILDHKGNPINNYQGRRRSDINRGQEQAYPVPVKEDVPVPIEEVQLTSEIKQILRRSLKEIILLILTTYICHFSVLVILAIATSSTPLLLFLFNPAFLVLLLILEVFLYRKVSNE